MKKDQIKVGQVYRAMINGRVVPCSVDKIRNTFMGRGKDVTVYDVTNMTTGRRTTFRSAMKFRELVAENPAVAGKVGPKEKRPTYNEAVASIAAEKDTRSEFDKINTKLAVAEEQEQAGIDATEDEQSLPFSPSPSATPTTAPSACSTSAAVPSNPLSSALHRAAVRKCRPIGDGPVAGMNPTDEQRGGLQAAVEVFERKAGPRVLVLVAGAGCGKTATLRMLEEALPGQGQYTAFNSSIVKDSAAKFRRVACNTTHSLAFRDVGKLYKGRLNGKRVRSAEVARMLGIEALVVPNAGVDEATGEPKPKMLQADFLASRVMMAVKRFCQSADREVMPCHFRPIAGIELPDADGRFGRENNDRVTEHLLPFARKAWADLASVDGTLPFSHDCYVKIWAMGAPYIPADYILLDEHQDTAPVMVDVLKQQTHAMLILVGDDNQRIYEWRGAINAGDEFPDAPCAMLSQSFRFGQAVADVANAVLRTLEEPTDLVLRGLPSIPSCVGPVEAPRCHLSRTNAGAVGQLLAGLAEGKRGHLIGGGSDVVDFVKAVVALQQGRGTSHPELACFGSWTEVEAFAKTEEGEDLTLMVRLVKKFGAAEILRALEAMPAERDADFVCCTAHKSKGREWPTVKLGADFPTADRMGDSDRRLLYVAATRAQEELDVTECPPFACRERARTEDEEGEEIGLDGPSSRMIRVPVIEVTFTVPMPTAEQLNEWREGKQRSDKPSVSVAPKEFTWANMDGGWLVRGPKVEVGTRVTVVRKNGSTSTETVKSVAKQLGELWFYRV